MQVFQPLTGCCCGFSLRTGTKLIGWTYLILSTLILAMMTLIVIAQGDEEVVGYPWVVILILVAEFGLAIVLIIGVYKNQSKLIRSWVVINSTKDTLIPVFFITAIVTSFPRSIFHLLLPFAMIDVYFIRVVDSFHKEMCIKPDQVSVLSDIV